MLDIRVLTTPEILEKLKDFSGWSYADNKLKKEFKFPSFALVVSFLDDLGPFCDRIDHHPDIHIFYTRVVFELQRFSVGGKVTERDFTVAKEIERLYSELSA